MNEAIGGAVGILGLGILIMLGIAIWNAAKFAGAKGLELGKKAVHQTKDHLNSIPDSAGVHDDLYAKAYQEMISSNVDAASWGKALVGAYGDKEKGNALYIKYRVEQLKHSTKN